MDTTTSGQPQTTDPAALIEAHLGLVTEVVRRTTSRFPSHVDRDDLRGAGAIGLVEAAHRYDAATGVPFARYATIRIRGSVLDVTRSRDWATRRLRRDLRAIDQTTSELEHDLGRRPDDREVAEALGVPEASVRSRRAGGVQAVLLALEGPDHGMTGGGARLAERLQEQDTAWLPEPAAERAELSEMLHAAIAQLPDPLRHVLVAHHLDDRPLRDIAAELGCTEARVSQLGIEALHALRAYFATRYPDVVAVPASAPGKRRRAHFVARVTQVHCRAPSRTAGHPDHSVTPVGPPPARPARPGRASGGGASL